MTPDSRWGLSTLSPMPASPRDASIRAEVMSYAGDPFGGSPFAGPMHLQGDAVPGRTDSRWDWGDFDFGNFRWQDWFSYTSEMYRARTLEDTNWLAASVLDRAIERVIGTLIVVEPRTNVPEFDAEVRRWLDTYWNTAGCDIRGLFSWSKICHLLYRGKLRDGDGGLVLTQDSRGNPKVQLIEKQRIKNPIGGVDLRKVRDAGNQLFDGVEMDVNGAPVAYWISFRNPGGVEQFSRVDARNFIYQMRTNRISSTRGVSAFRGGYWLFDNVVGWCEASVIAARVGANQAMVQFRKNPGTQNAPNVAGGTLPNPRGTPWGQQRVVPMAPGAITTVDADGEDLKSFNPSQPTQSMPEGIATFCRFIGIRFGLTLEDVLLDFSRTTYSSGKMARSAAKKAAEIDQDDFGCNVISRVYQWALSKAVKNGIIKTPAPENFWDHEWLAPTWPSPEPVKDATAVAMEIQMGVNSRSNYAAQNGYDFRKLVVQNKADETLLKEANLSTALPVATNKPADAAGDRENNGGSGSSGDTNDDKSEEAV